MSMLKGRDPMLMLEGRDLMLKGKDSMMKGRYPMSMLRGRDPVMTTHNYDPDAFSFTLSSSPYHPSFPYLSVQLPILLFSLFCSRLFPCTFTTASPAQPGL